MEALNNILKSLMTKFPKDIDVDKIKADWQKKRRDTFQRFSELYPGVFISGNFVHEVMLAESEELPCENCKGYPCAKKQNQGWRHEVRRRISCSLWLL